MTKHHNRRRLLQSSAAFGLSASAGLLSLSAGRAAHAQNTPIKLMVGFAAGGSVDLLARSVAEQLTQKTGRAAIVENRTGAAGRLAVDAVKTAKPDGDTLLVCPQGPLTLFPYIFKNLKYDPFKDLMPVTRLTVFDVAIGLGPLSGADSLPKFLEWAKANPTKANFGSSGAGTLLHFTGTSLSQLSGVPLTHVPYKGAAPAVADLIGANVPMVVAPLSDMLEQHKAGRLKVVAVTSPERGALAPEIPTCKELGLPLEVPGWFALYGPAGLSTEVVDNLNRVVHEALGSPQMRERFLKMGMVPAPTTRSQTLELQRAESAIWERMVKASGFTPED
jgi:tripartite-type tricarboxylate transporter receptor subunit TctC